MMREDWVAVEYKTLVDKVSTVSQKLKQKEYLPEGKLAVVDQGQELIGGYTDDESKQLDCALPVIVFGDHTKIVKLINFPFAPGADGTKVLQPKKPILPRYISYLTKILVFKIEDKGYARHYQHIEKQYFPLAPLPEQRAIVAKIEQLFSELDNGITNLKAAKAKLAIYRQAVLNFVMVDGKSVFISDVVEELTQGWSPKCINQSTSNPEEWAVIKTSAIQSGKFLEFENKILPETLTPREQHEIQKKDILITRAGPRVRVGVCCLVKRTRPKLINCDKVYRIRLKQYMVLPEFFEYMMNSPEYVNKIEEIKTGGNDSGLNLTQNRFLNLKIPLPSIEEQKQIVLEIETRLSICDNILRNIEEGLAKAEALRQSILKKAFEGKLLNETELAACRQQPDWEPAEKLLARIQRHRRDAMHGVSTTTTTMATKTATTTTKTK